MKQWGSLRAMQRNVRLLIGLVVVLSLVGCGLGEAVMPNPPTGVPADRSAGLVAPVPAPIPHSLEGREECFTCHAIGAVDAPPVPVDHEEDVTLCTTCHAVWLAPAIAAAAPPAIPHEVEGRSDCLVCHKLGTADAPRVPDNHNGLASDICQTCHTQVVEIAGGAGGVVPIGEIPTIPHGLEGFSACTQCHEEGGAGIPRFPDDHQGRTDDICTACHESEVEEVGAMSAEEATATPAATAEEEATPAPEPTATPTESARATPTEPAEAEPTSGTVATPTEAASEAMGDAANGEAVFGTRCAPCHGPDGEGTTIAPDALHDAALLAELTDEDLATAIQQGVGDIMPAFSTLSDQEILDLIAFLRSWQ
jgi:mono/diheme cytochrome c family protein